MRKRPSKKDRIRKHILGLKLKMSEAKELDEIGTYFFDHLGENSVFMDMGSPVRHELLEQVAIHIYQKITGDDTVMLHRQIFISLPKYKFIHGPCMLNQYMANVIYFEDLDAGLMMLTKFSGRTEFARFSVHSSAEKPPFQNN